MQEHDYKPKRLPPEAERTISQESLRTALAIARRVHETNPATQQEEPTTEDGYWEINAQIRIAEAEALRTWASTNGLLLDANDFTKKWIAFGEIEGGEHQLFQTHGWFHKRNNMAYHRNYLEYFHRVVLHNYLFPETALEFEGLMDHDDLLQPVIRQKALAGVRGATRNEVEAEMALRGFIRRFADNYYSITLGILVEDLHDENVLVDPDGDLLIFDPVLYIAKPEIKLPE